MLLLKLYQDENREQEHLLDCYQLSLVQLKLCYWLLEMTEFCDWLARSVHCL